ncbi:MAG: DUF4169 family protein [Pseudomonadota bacterium]
MADVVNLRMARKAKKRADQRAQAHNNRIAHGVSGAQRKAARCAAARQNEILEGHRVAPTAEEAGETIRKK